MESNVKTTATKFYNCFYKEEKKNVCGFTVGMKCYECFRYVRV